MRETYWEKFMATVSVADYLTYKMQQHTAGKEEKTGRCKQPGRQGGTGKEEGGTVLWR